MEQVRSRFIADSPANFPLYPEKIQRKSLLRNHLPVSTVASILCAGLSPFAPYVFNTLRAEGRGRGTLQPALPDWESPAGFGPLYARSVVFEEPDVLGYALLFRRKRWN